MTGWFRGIDRKHQPSSSPTGWALWHSAVLHALPVTALVLGLFYYWFAIADR